MTIIVTMFLMFLSAAVAMVITSKAWQTILTQAEHIWSQRMDDVVFRAEQAEEKADMYRIRWRMAQGDRESARHIRG